MGGVNGLSGAQGRPGFLADKGSFAQFRGESLARPFPRRDPWLTSGPSHLFPEWRRARDAGRNPARISEGRARRFRGPRLERILPPWFLISAPSLSLPTAEMKLTNWPLIHYKGAGALVPPERSREQKIKEAKR